MDKEEFKKWLEDAVSDSFMDLFYYNRKGCEIMPLNTIKTMEENGILTEKLLLEVFSNQIKKEFQ